MGLLNFSARFPKLTIFLLLGISAFYASKISTLRIDASVNSILVESDPEYIYYQDSKEWFGSDNVTSIVFKDKNLYTKEKLQILQDLVFELEIWDEVEKVDSLFTSPHFENIEDTLQTVPLLDIIPDSIEEIEKIKQRALRNPFFAKTIINPDGRLMTINVSLLKDNSNGKMSINFAKKLDEKLKEYENKFDEVFQLGTPELSRRIEMGIFGDQKFIIPLSIITITLLLFLTMRSFTSAIFPIITGALSVIWTFGQMSMLDIPLQMLTMGIPVLLLVIGSTEDTHIISEYDEALHIKRGIIDEALNYLSQKISVPILLTTITTAIGFSTIILNDIRLLKEFGLACSLGLIFNFIITVTLSPILLKHAFKNSTHQEDQENYFTKLADKIFDFIHRHYKLALISVGIITICALFLSQFVITNNSSLDMLKKDNPIRVNIEKTDGEIGGIYSFYLVLDAPEGKNFKQHELAQKVFEIENLKKKYPNFISGQSYTSLLALIHREFNDGKAENYVIPKNTNLINQYFLFLSPDDLRNFLTLDYIKANVIFRHNISSTSETLKIIEELDHAVKEILKDTGIKYHFTGRRFLTDKASKTIVDSQVSSLFIISVCVFFIIFFLFLDFRIAVFSLVPNIVPIAILFAIMGLFDIYLDVGTCTIAAVAIGIAADDTLHFLARVEQNLKIYFNKTEAIRATLRQEMRPIICTSFSLAFGLALLGLSSFVPLMKFGTLLALCIITAFLSDILITPVLMLFMDETKFVSVVEIFRYRIAPYVLKTSQLFKEIDPKTARNMILNGNLLEIEKFSSIPNKIIENNDIFIVQGQLKVSRMSSRGGEGPELITIGSYNAGQYIKIGSIEANFSDLNIQALNHCKILLINSKFINKIKNNYPEYSQKIEDNILQINNTN